jgi:uncharacterized protein (DUF3820 family)
MTAARTIRTAEIIGYYSLPSPSLAEHNPTAYNLALLSAPRNAGYCSHCGMGIIHHVIICDENGVVRAIGSDCATKVGLDAAQIRTKRTHAEVAEAKAKRERELAETDWSVFQFGKYQGRSVRDVFAEDPDYVDWFAGSFATGEGRLRTQALCRELVAPMHAAAKAVRASRCQAIIAAFGEDTIRECAEDEDFSGSVCRDLLAGREPSDRAIGILMEIVAKWSGRRNSKAYNAAYEAIEEKLPPVREAAA